MLQTLKRLRTIALMVVFLFYIGYTKASAQTEENKDTLPPNTVMGVIISTCKSLDAITNLAMLDRDSQKSATQFFVYLISIGECGRLAQPMRVFLDKRVEKYTDSIGESIEVWSLLGAEHWALVRSDLIRYDDDRNKKNDIAI